MKNILPAFAAILFLGISTLGWGQQIKTPRPSPTATLSQEVGLTQFTINYSRPGVKGRTIFGDLVPYGEKWRTGANGPTTIEFDKDIKLEGQEIKRGKYAIITIPSANEWEFILSKNAKTRPQNHDEKDDALRFKVPVQKTDIPVESFTIDFQGFSNTGATLVFLWENAMVSVNVEVSAHDEVLASIDQMIKGPSSRDLYISARYYYDNDMDLSKAVNWINQSVEMDKEDPKFWVLYWQAKILAKSGDKKGAMEASQKSREYAEKEKYDSYVKMNDELMQELEK